jgi:hypothetical protein
MIDKRVVFDFEIHFSGDDISDDALAAHVIRDLRLLMVGNVRILNKKIIEGVANTRTYLDTPFHRYAGGHDLATLAIDKVSNVPGLLVHATGNEHRAIDWVHFAAEQRTAAERC